MSTRPLKGIPLADVRKIMRDGVSEKTLLGDGTEPINARCIKCGADLRATPWLLKHIATGVVDHGPTCGGTYRLLAPADLH